MLQGVYVKLKNTLDPNVNQSRLYEMGIDTTLVDLQDETEKGGQYFRPMSLNRWQMLSRNPKPITFHWERQRPSMADAYVLFDRITHQLRDWEEEGAPGPSESTRWESVG